MKKILLFLFFFCLIGILSFSFYSKSSAYWVEDLKIPSSGDIVLGPGKTELWLNPGEESTKELMITNRTGETRKFVVNIEDFVGSKNPEQTVVLLGDQKSRFSLKDYLKPEIFEFTLNHGQRMNLPVKISIPSNAEPGGLYGSVLVTALPIGQEQETEKNKAKGQINIATRLGTLFFLRIKGEVIENGFLKELKLKNQKLFYEKGPISFQVLFENNGNVHLNPYGIIEIKNLFGKKIDEIELSPWFAMPDSLRLKEVNWNKKFLFGKYTAMASINRGYKNIIDEKIISFWVIPWKFILIGIIGIFLIFWLLYWITTHLHFEIKVKPKNNK